MYCLFLKSLNVFICEGENELKFINSGKNVVIKLDEEFIHLIAIMN